MKYLFTALFFALTLSAQTNIPLSSLRADEPGERLLVYAPGVGIFFVQFDPTQVTIDRTTTPFTLRLTIPAPAPAPVVPTEKRVNIKAGVGITITEVVLPEVIKTGSLKFYKNGILLSEGDDYTLTTNALNQPVVQLVASQAIIGPSAVGKPGDNAVALYLKE